MMCMYVYCKMSEVIDNNDNLYAALYIPHREYAGLLAWVHTILVIL